MWMHHKTTGLFTRTVKQPVKLRVEIIFNGDGFKMSLERSLISTGTLTVCVNRLRIRYCFVSFLQSNIDVFGFSICEIGKSHWSSCQEIRRVCPRSLRGGLEDECPLVVWLTLAKSQVERKDATAEVVPEVLEAEAEVAPEVAGDQGGHPVQGREESRCGLFLGLVHTERQRHFCHNAAMMLAILFSLKTVESLENGLQPHPGATPMFSMRTESLALSQSYRNVDSDTQCKLVLMVVGLGGV